MVRPRSDSPVKRTPAQEARHRRREEFGLDCTDQITIQGFEWCVGKSVTKSFVVKNVSLKPVKFIYKLPPNESFAMPFPEPIFLAPAVSTTLSVTFRPGKYSPHTDFIRICTPTGEFSIRVDAFCERKPPKFKSNKISQRL